MGKTPLTEPFSRVESSVKQLDGAKFHGHVKSILGMVVEVAGINEYLSVGDRCYIINREKARIACEIVGFKEDHAIAMAFGNLEGVGLGARVEVSSKQAVVMPAMSWLGRIIDGLGNPIDGKGPLEAGPAAVPLRNKPPLASARARVGDKIDLGIRSINTFLTACRGQRMGIFSGSGVGKSTMLSMIARYTDADVNVIGLVGERGREVTEFIEDDLGEEGLKRSIIIVATGDESPLMRRQAAYLTLSVAEFFRDHGKDVLCMIDSVTRFAMAQREIGLSAGEPPASKGYTPTVFSELPKLLERAGPGHKGQTGSITGLFTVLVEGDDHNEPISDAVRGILDGHIVLDRNIAQQGRYPPVNILQSVSRMLPDCNTDFQNEIVERARQLMAAYDNMAEMIRLGAYKRGSDPKTDEAIEYRDHLEEFLGQRIDEQSLLEPCYQQLAEILGMTEAVETDETAEDANQIPSELIGREA